MLETVYGQTKNKEIADLLRTQLNDGNINGTYYIGYPIISSADEKTEIDALLVSEEHGLIAFLFESTLPTNNDIWNEFADRQDQLFYAIESSLSRHEGLRLRRKLAINIEVISLFPNDISTPPHIEGRFVGLNSVVNEIRGCHPIETQYLPYLQAALQRVTTIKPRKKRQNVTKGSSFGGVLKIIEKEIANLDQWQKKAAIETPDGPQRIRGLAGSGKTVVLALKAAYLHSQHPEWNIAITFQTRSLYQQFKDLIRRFSYEHSNDEPNWEKIKVLHAWGSYDSEGIYTEIAANTNAIARDFLYGKSKFGMNNAFKGVCSELLAITRNNSNLESYDAILIDEAQDLPAEFFKLIYVITKSPKRIIWAYDELQTLSEAVMPGMHDLFGTDKSGNPLVSLENIDGQPRQDIILPICYRNTPWALTLAHSLGFGVYRENGLVQHFDDPGMWEEIGYYVSNGELTSGSDIELKRDKNSYPEFFKQYIKQEDAIQHKSFEEQIDQAEWVASSIEKNLREDELEHDDILIILPSALTAKKEAQTVISALMRRGIMSHLSGVTSSRDKIFEKNSIAIAHIYRSKGNEAPMVYILNAHQCYSGSELTKLRNILFTSITRSKAWVRILGLGNPMDQLIQEIERLYSEDFKLKFSIPTEPQLKKMRRLHRDKTQAEKVNFRKASKNFKSSMDVYQKGEITLDQLLDQLPEEMRRKFLNEISDLLEKK